MARAARDELMSSGGERRQDNTPMEGSARALLLTVLGELVVPGGKPVWTAALLHVLTGLGVAERTARQTLARAGDRGWISGERIGRTVRWSVMPSATELIDDISRRVASLSAPPEHWDGKGIFLNVTVLQEKKLVRKRLYSALGWAGFGNPTPGLWTNPHIDRLDETRAIIEELGLSDSTIVSVGQLADVGLTVPQIIVRGWQLDEVAGRYAKLLDTYQDIEPAPGDELLVTYLTLVDEWRKFPAMDPQLPKDVLPDWIGRRAADKFVTLRAKWKPAAHERWAEVVQLTAPNR